MWVFLFVRICRAAHHVSFPALKLSTAMKILRRVSLLMIFSCVCRSLLAQPAEKAPALPDHIYIPYKDLEGVLGKDNQGVFLPYKDFQNLWKAARGQPAKAPAAGPSHLLSAARFTGTVKEKLARMRLKLTVDILKEGWSTIPIGLGKVGVSSVGLAEEVGVGAGAKPLLRFQNNRYEIIAKGPGRQVVEVEFVLQLVTQPGRNLLQFSIPAAAINTLELTIPEENLKVDVQPMLAASTSQKDLPGGASATQLQAFLGQSGNVALSWAPKSQAASDLAPVLISTQSQHLRIGEALLQHEAEFNYEIRRRGMKAFHIRVPADYRVVAVDGENLEKWDIENPDQGAAAVARHKGLRVSLFSEVESQYRLRVRMEKFLQEASATFPLVPIYTEDALRLSGLIGVSHAPRRSVELSGFNEELVRVETSRLPERWRKVAGITAYRFTSGSYAADVRTGVLEPRINLQQLWALRVDRESLQLQGQLHYHIERAGVFSVTMSLPDGWEVEELGPTNLVDDYEIKGEGASRTLVTTLRKETMGLLQLHLRLRKPLVSAEGPVVLDLPQPASENLNRFKGQFLLYLSEALRAETGELRQLKSMPLRDAIHTYGKRSPSPGAGFNAVMAYEFSSVDLDVPVGVTFQLAVKPAQVSAEFFRNVDIRAGNVSHEAIIRYQVRYAPVDTFYLKYPAALAEAGLQITGPDLKEKPRIDALPVDQAEAAGEGGVEWIYHKIALQSPRMGAYDLRVAWRESFQALPEGGESVAVEPILAAGKLAGQSGAISMAKAPNLAIGVPSADNLQPADPSSPRDIAYESHRSNAVLAFRCDKPPFALALPVVLQQEAEVYTAIVNAAIHEQALARDGALNGRSIFLISSNRGDRIKLAFPPKARIYAFLLDGKEIQVEAAEDAGARIVRLPPSAGQVSKVVLETTYGMDEAATGKLPVPTLPAGVPVQRTWWRLWAPEDHQLLSYDRNFERPQYGSSLEGVFQSTGSGHAFHASSFDQRGTLFEFEKQGGAEVLKLNLQRKETVAIVVWVIVIAAGIGLMRLGYFERIRVALILVAVVGLWHLFQPLAAWAVAGHAAFPSGLVAVLWVGQLLFWSLPKSLKSGRESFLAMEQERARAEPAPPEDPPPADAPPQEPESEGGQ